MPPSKRKRESLGQENGFRDEGRAPAAMSDVGGVDERIVAKRAEMLQSRQVQLEQLMTEHDDNICEAFHLEKFVTLLEYDPKIAKSDTSQVFLEYKAEHDLLNKSAEATVEQSPARKTRRARTELRSSLAANITNGQSPLIMSSPQSVSSPLKGKGKARGTPRTDISSFPKQRPEKSSSLHTLSPLNGHFKASRRQTVSVAPKSQSSPSEPRLQSSHPLPSPSRPLSPSSAVSSLPPRSLPTPSPPPPPKTPPPASSLPRIPPSEVSEATASITAAPQRCPAETGQAQTSGRPEEAITPTSPAAIMSLPPRGVKRKASSSPIDLDQVPEQALEPQIESVPSCPKPKVRRVVLFVRPPPIKYTHPDQMPPSPKYKSSLHGYLKSYRSMEDEEEETEQSLEEKAEMEAKKRAQIRALKRDGRLMLNVNDIPDGVPASKAVGRPLNEPQREQDAYDRVLAAIPFMSGALNAERVHKKNTAKKIAKSVLAWHGNRESAEEKQRKAEALQLRNLAKYTAKEIEKQWRKAVMTIRERQRAILEEEEARLGQKHLDAILDQSGMILEAQQMDLTRRSRSSSAPGWSDNEDSGTDEEASDEEHSQADASDGGDSGGEGDDDMDVDPSYLVGEDTAELLRSASSDAGTDNATDDADDEEEQDASDAEPGDDELLPAPSLAPSVVDEDETMSSLEQDDADRVKSALQSEHEDDEEEDEEASEAPSVMLEDLSDEMDVPELPSAIQDHHVGRNSPRSGSSMQEGVEEGQQAATTPSQVQEEDLADSPHPEEPTPLSGTIMGVGRDPSTSPIENSLMPDGDDFQSEAPLVLQTVSTVITKEVKMEQLEATGQPHLNGIHDSPNSLRMQDGGTVESPVNGEVEVNGSKAPSTVETIAESKDASPIAIPSRQPDALEEDSVEVSEEPVDVPVSNGDISPEVDSSEIRVTAKGSSAVLNGVEEPKGHVESIPTTPAEKVAESTAGQSEELQAQAEGPQAQESEESESEDDLPPYLADFAVAPVDYNPESKVGHPFLLRGVLRPYQQSGLEWLASLHTKTLNGILADEMGLGKTIQTISLLAHLACDRGIWGPHLIIVPTSVLLNWEMEFKKFLPGFKILPYHGNTKRRKELRVGWNNKHAFNVCVTSYTLASRDAHIFKRKAWYYMILDEAHMIKNFKSQRWNTLLMFRSFRRLLLTGTPLQNNLTELWALLQFLMSGTNFANLKEFGDWFSNPLEKAIEQGTVMDEESQERVRKLHTVLRPYLLRRLKKDVEKELPQKFEHLVMCRLSKRQRFLYDEFMSRAQTQESLASGVYHKVANILMQLRKVCNHPDLFEVRPIVTSFAMPRSAVVDYEIKELLVRRRLLQVEDEKQVNLDFLGLVFVQLQGKSMVQARATQSLDASHLLVSHLDYTEEPPPQDYRTIAGFQSMMEYQRKVASLRQWTQISYVNRLRCAGTPVYGSETISMIRELHTRLLPENAIGPRKPDHLEKSSTILPQLVKSYVQREEELAGTIDRFAFVTPAVIANGMASLLLRGYEGKIREVHSTDPSIDNILHRATVKLQIAFPDSSLIQYDCGKLQELAALLRKRAAGGHRVLIFTQMTKVLDILEIFLNFHGYRYLRLDGATKIEDRQYITERFNNDPRIFAFIASSRSGGVGINLTGADTVVFYDSDFNPQMDRQCEDRAHRIGQIRDVHIYRFVSEHTVEEAMLRKANQKRTLDNVVIQQGAFDWRNLFIEDAVFGKVLEQFVDQEDAYAARIAAREEEALVDEDMADFAAEGDEQSAAEGIREASIAPTAEEDPEEDERTIADYMLSFVDHDWEWFSTWRV